MSIQCFAERSQCCLALAQRIAQLSNTALQQDTHFSIVLSGGSTPQYLYELLAKDEWQEQIKWEQAHIFFGDERCVPKDHADCNYRMAYESLLQHLPTPASQIHRIKGENNPVAEAARYEKLIKTILTSISSTKPIFTLTLLGLGRDGHTASLFPGDSTLQTSSIVTSVPTPRAMSPAVERISLSLKGIGRSRNICFLVHGKGKEQMVDEALSAKDTAYPASLVQRFKPFWYLSGMNCEKLR